MDMYTNHKMAEWEAKRRISEMRSMAHKATGPTEPSHRSPSWEWHMPAPFEVLESLFRRPRQTLDKA